MVLADNVDGGDDLDLIVTTMNGNVFCFSTPSPHHVLKVSRCGDVHFKAHGHFTLLELEHFPLCPFYIHVTYSN